MKQFEWNLRCQRRSWRRTPLGPWSSCAMAFRSRFFFSNTSVVRSWLRLSNSCATTTLGSTVLYRIWRGFFSFAFRFPYLSYCLSSGGMYLFLWNTCVSLLMPSNLISSSFNSPPFEWPRSPLLADSGGSFGIKTNRARQYRSCSVNVSSYPPIYWST
ncbi:unnamed protein product [Tuber aestivum]|uniref:Uncharacterized protein n=1 Tax=Tuber aestivum TaxID=59557 RepID=A0A292QAD2_9PEZI|nr:unnamed protein product [Tuber aestivum]